MEKLVVTTVVYVPPEDAYDFLVDFTHYADYSEHLRRVRGTGDGGAGTRYELVFAWWKLTYTVRSEVTETDPPACIEWRLVSGLDAHGRWVVEPTDVPDDAPADATAASRVTFEVAFDPHSAEEGMLDLPRFVSLGWVVDRVRPLIQEEAERVVERVVADLEGRPRSVDLSVERRERKG